MTVAPGEAVYSAGDPPCTGLGLEWSGEELDAALDGPVAAMLFDDEGKADIEEILRGIVETSFEQDGLRRVLADPERIEDWRVGEAIAETWLTDHRDCRFPWPDGTESWMRPVPFSQSGVCRSSLVDRSMREVTVPFSPPTWKGWSGGSTTTLMLGADRCHAITVETRSVTAGLDF